MANIKWHTNDVQFIRGNFRPVIAKFDNSKKWFTVESMVNTQGARDDIRKLAQEYNAKEITLQYMYDDNDKPTVDLKKDVVAFLKLSDRYVFRREIKVPEGAKRQFIEFNEDDIFKKTRFVTVYRDEIEPHGWADNLVEIAVEENDLKDFLSNSPDNIPLEQFFDEYTADDTMGLVNYLKSKGKFIVPDDVLFTRSLINMTIEASKYLPEEAAMNLPDINRVELQECTDGYILNLLKTDLFPHIPEEKKNDFMHCIKLFEKNVFPEDDLVFLRLAGKIKDLPEDNYKTEYLSGSCIVDGVPVTIDDSLKNVTEKEIRSYLKYVKEQAAQHISLQNLSINPDKNGTVAIDYTLKPIPFNRIRRITGYLVGDTSRWNNAKKSELNDRVKHTGVSR